MRNVVIILALFFLACWPHSGIPSEPTLLSSVDTVEEADEILLSFSSLGCFADRGLAVSFFSNFERQDEFGLSKDFISLPKEVQRFLVQGRIAPQSEEEFPWSDCGRKMLGGESLNRFCRLGLIDLLYLSEHQVLDSPLEKRVECKEQMMKVINEAAKVQLALSFSPKITYNRKLVAIGRLRRLSTDFDTAVLSALSDQERIKLAGIVVHILPVARKLVEQDALEYELGSGSLGVRARGAPH